MNAIGPVELALICLVLLLAVTLLFGIGLILVRSPRRPGRQAASGEARVPCPYCGELIYPEAKICPNCGRDVTEPARP